MMAGFFQQLRLLLWKNGLGVIRQPGWSLVLLIWPVVIFIILAITRSQFPPVPENTCYVAPRNLPSAGFFPFLQTLMCNTDSSCSNNSYLEDSKSKSLRQRRDVNTHSSPFLLHGLPPLPDLEKFGLAHTIMKRDTSNVTEILQQWDTWLNSSIQTSSNLTSILDALNNTEQDVLSTILDSTDLLKTIFCNISMSALSDYSPITSSLEHFCMSSDTALEVSLSTLNQLMTQLVLQDPAKVIEVVEMSVETINKLQTQSPLWDFLLGLPDVFLKSTDQERIMAISDRLKELKAWNSIQSSSQQANASMDMLNPIIDEGIELLNYLQTWEGRNVNISLVDVLVPSNMSLISPDMATLIQDLQIPLDKVLVLFNRSAFSESVCTSRSFCDSQQVDIMYEWIDQEKVALQVLLAWSRSATSPADLAFAKDTLGKLFGGYFQGGPNTDFENRDSQPETLQEQLFLGVGNTVMGWLSGTPSWDYIQTLLMGTYSTMRFATAVMETQLAYVQPLLHNRENLQTTMWSLVQNETGVDNEEPWLDVGQKLNEVSSVFDGTLVYNVTPAMILTEWHRLYSTALQFSDSVKEVVELVQGKLFSQIPHNSTVDWSEILLNSGLEEFATMGSILQNSSQWSTMEPYFQLAYWIMTFQPNITAPPNCTFTPNDTICNIGFTWEGFIPVVGSLLQEINENPAALLRPIQGAESLLKGIMMDTYMNHLQEFLSSTGGSSQNLSLSLTDMVNQNLQFLLNIPPTDERDEDSLLAMLNGTLESFGLGQLGVLWSGGLNYSQPNSVVMNILHLLSPESIQMLHSDRKFAVLCDILHELGELLAPENQIQLERVLNHTNALFGDLALCAASGQDCLSNISQLFQILPLLDEMMAAGEGGNFTTMPIESNMTFSVAGHILSLLLPRNMSESSAYTMDNVSNMIYLLEQLSGSTNLSINDIQDMLQALNLTTFDLEQFTHLSEASSLPLLLSKLMELVNISQCLNPLFQDQASHIGSTIPECTMQIIEGLIGFLQAIPMLEDIHTDSTSILNMVFDKAKELFNISSLDTDLPGVTEEFLSGGSNYTQLNSVVMNILHLLSPESIQMLHSEQQFAVLHDILRKLGELLAPEQQIHLEGFLNRTHALFGDLALCAASGQDCLSNVSQLFQILPLLDEMMAAGEGGNITTMPIESNMTFSVAGHILSLLLPRNMSESSAYMMDNVSKIISLIEQLSGSTNLSINDIQDMLQALTLTTFDLEQFTHLSEASSLPLLLSKLTELVNISRCLNPLFQDQASHIGSTIPECTMQIIEGLIGFLQAIPMLEDIHTDSTSILNMVFDKAKELFNISSLDTDLPGVTEEFLSGGSNYTQLNSVVMNILHLLSPESIQMLHSERQFAVLHDILRKLGELLAPEQQIHLEGFLNRTHALFGDLALCAASGQDCLSNVSQLFQILPLLDEMMAAGEGGNFTMMPIESNMTFSVAGHILSLLLPRNMSESSAYMMDNVSKIISLIEQLSGSTNLSINDIQDMLQALTLTTFDLEQFTHLSEASSLPLLLSKLMELVNISQCLNPLFQDQASHIGSTIPECTMQIIEGLIGFLQAIPMLEDIHTDSTSILNMVFDKAKELFNISSLDTDLPGVTEEFLSGGSNYTQLNSVVMNILHLLSPESIQMLHSERQFAVLHDILRKLGELLAPEQQIHLEGFLNRTHALFGDLALCAASGQDCLSNVSQLFQILPLLDEMMAAGEGGNFTTMPIESNMTFSVAGHILSLLLPRNMSESSAYTMDNVSNMIYLLEQLSGSTNLSMDDIQDMLQALNLTTFDLEQFTHLSEASSLPMLLSKLMELVNISQCLNPLLQDPVSHIGSTIPECTMQIIEGLIGFLQAIPMFEGFQTSLTSTLNMVYDEAMKLRNISSLESAPLATTDEVLEVILDSIRLNLENLNVENVTLIKMELDTLEGLLKMVFDDEYRYPYYMINSTLMTQQSYAQKMYTEIIMWYLHNLENATNPGLNWPHPNSTK
ncbi:uncharacterized protein LOC128609332 [Ictalurus furcatus]|uniref:uncharacterized protein LOC128609332 n=1 Tax=Ictalurus furcatus TaxID=66913 RepID=UPI002350C634|nr:uncharacterized protein LOC128609332 [Ictalurus furcatus]